MTEFGLVGQTECLTFWLLNLGEVSPIFLDKALWELSVFQKIQLQLSMQQNRFQQSVAALYNQKIQL